MKIQVYGKGCPKCNKLAANVEQALEQLGRDDVEVEHVTDLDEIARMGPIITPALVVDGKVLTQGMAYSPRKLVEILKPLLNAESA